MHIEVRYVKEDDVDVVADMIARLKTLNEELDPHFKVVDNLEDETRNYVRESLGSSNVVMLLAYNASTGEPVGLVRLEIVDRIFYKLYGIPVIYYHVSEDDGLEASKAKYLLIKVDEMGEKVEITDRTKPGWIGVPLVNLESKPPFIPDDIV